MIPVDDDLEDSNLIQIVTDSGKTFSITTQEDSFSDPFMGEWGELIKMDGIRPEFKRAASRKIQKAYTGAEDAKSKKLDPLDLTGYSLFQIVQPPYNVQYLAQLYDISPFHHAAVDAKVENIFGLGYKFQETPKLLEKLESAKSTDAIDKMRKKVKRMETDLHELIAAMNSDDSFEEILNKIGKDYETTGNAYLEVGRTSSGKIGFIGHIPATTMRIRRHRDGFVQVVYNRYTFFRNFGDTSTKDQIGTDPRPNEVIHFKNYTPTNTYYGVPDVLAAKNAIAGDEFAARYNLDYFENKAVPRYIITIKGARLAPDSERKLLEFFQIGLKGRNHRTLYIPLPSDGENERVEFDMKPIEAGNQDSSFHNYTIECRDRILFAQRVPITKIGIPADINLSNSKDSDKTFKESVCRPRQDFFEQKINRVIAELTDAFKLKFNELTLTDEETQANIDQIYLRMKSATPNEVRAKRGQPPIDGGDEVVEMKPQDNAEQKTQATGNRERDQNRSANATDRQGGRNPKGDGRKVA